MKTVRYLLLALTLSSCIAQAQNKNKFKITLIDDDPTPIHYPWLGGDSKILTSMKLIYQKPDGFTEVSDTECFDDNLHLKSAFSCLPNQLHADDQQFIAFMPVFRLPTPEDSIMMVRYLYPNNPSGGSLDIMHINQIKGLLRSILDEKEAKEWKKIVTYYPQEVARNKFNADTVMRFSITLRPEEYYKKEFKYVDALFLQKNGRKYINFYCFYTDKAKEHLADYWRKIESVLHYQD